MHDPLPSCSVIIATLDRLESLVRVLDCLSRQTHPPDEVLIAAAGDAAAVERLVQAHMLASRTRVLPQAVKSSARQRNAAAAVASGNILAFLDDDIEFAPDLFAKLLTYFVTTKPAPGAIGARIPAEDRRTPGQFALAYYRLQAGYAHANYGGRLFGPAINCTPIYEPDSPELTPTEWLPATCLFVRAECFHAERFPLFDGYSYAEDVHLTARIGRAAPLFFATHCPILHHSLNSEFKRDVAALTAGKLRNMTRIAQELLGLHGWRLQGRMLLHRMFMTLATLRTRSPRWWDVLRGTWRLGA